MKYIKENLNSNYEKIIQKIIDSNKNIIFEFFGEKLEKLPFNVYIYDNIKNLSKGLKERGFKNDPDYMCACHKDEDNSLNFFEPKDTPNDNEWSKEEYNNVIFHELIHGIQFTLFGNNYEWFNEGIAKYLDGQYKSGMKYLFDNYINCDPVPPQYEIENEFGMHKYDSYDYAYIMVSYLIESLEKKDFLELVKDKTKVDKIKNNLLIDSINYYNEKIKKDESNKRR